MNIRHWDRGTLGEVLEMPRRRDGQIFDEVQEMNIRDWKRGMLFEVLEMTRRRDGGTIG